jgi:hypothetical protein
MFTIAFIAGYEEAPRSSLRVILSGEFLHGTAF